MKKGIILVTILAILLISTTAYADNALKKLSRGVMNMDHIRLPFRMHIKNF